MEINNEIVLDGKQYVLKNTKQPTTLVKLKKDLSYCIIRTYSAGVFAGWINRKIKGKENIVYNARRLWKWSGALDCSQLAMNGIDNADDCKFSSVAEVDLKEIIEISLCTKKAKESIESVKEWSK